MDMFDTTTKKEGLKVSRDILVGVATGLATGLTLFILNRYFLKVKL